MRAFVHVCYSGRIDREKSRRFFDEGGLITYHVLMCACISQGWTFANLCFTLQKRGLIFAFHVFMCACILQGWTFANFGMRYARTWLDTFQGRFPVRVELWLIANPPPWFNVIWKLIRPMIQKEFAQKVGVFLPWSSFCMRLVTLLLSARRICFAMQISWSACPFLPNVSVSLEMYLDVFKSRNVP